MSSSSARGKSMTDQESATSSSSPSSTISQVIENLPSTKDLTKRLDQVKKEIHHVETTTALDETGSKILDDTEKLITDAQKVMLEKNPDDQLQRMIIEGHRASEELKAQAERLKDMEEEAISNIHSKLVRQLAQKTLKTAKMAGIEVLSSGSFRRSCMEFIQLASDILGDVVVDVVSTEISDRGIPPPPGMKKMKKDKGKERLDAPLHGGERTKRVAEEVKVSAEGTINSGLAKIGSKQHVELDQKQIEALAIRFNKLIENISKRERTKKVFHGILEIFRLLGSETEELTEETRQQVRFSVNEITKSGHLRQTLELAKELFEHFTGRSSLDALIVHVKAAFEIIANDPETLAFFEDLRRYVLKVLANPQLMQHPDQQSILEGRRLVRRGRQLRDHPVLDHLRAILAQLKTIVTAMEEDPATLKLKEDMDRLVADVMLDEDGNFVWKPEVVEQLRLILVSSIIERLKIPVPTIHMDDDDMEFTVTGLVVALRSLVPDRVTIENRGKVVLNLTDVQQPQIAGAGHAMRIILENINVHVPSAHFWFRRKKFPRVEEEGNARLDIGGRGMDVSIVVRTFLQPDLLFRVESVLCSLHDFRLHLADTKHDFLYNAVLRLFHGTIKNEIETSIENTLANSLEQLNSMIATQICIARHAIRDLPEIAKVAKSTLPIPDSVDTAVDKVKIGAQAVVASVTGMKSPMSTH